MSVGGKNRKVQMHIKSQVPIHKDVNEGLGTVSYLAINILF